MAEKEERILVLTTHNKDGECECVTQDGCHANDSCAICNVGMTRQEAIERIARAICRSGENECIGDCASCDLWKVGPEKDYAEAALNALLEGK